MTTTEARVEQYQTLLQKTAEQLGQPVDAEVVMHVACFRMLRENLQARMLLGEHVDPADLIRIDEVLRAYLPRGTHTVEIIFGDEGGPPGWKPPERAAVSSGNGSSRPEPGQTAVARQQFPMVVQGESGTSPAATEAPSTHLSSRDERSPPQAQADDHAVAPARDITAGFDGWLRQGGDQSWRRQDGGSAPNFEAAHQLPMPVIK